MALIVTPSMAITNVSVFDGFQCLQGLQRVTMSGGRITAIEDAGASSPSDARGAVIDGTGATLLPGLIDTHVHVHNRGHVERAAQWGVTTQLDMGAPDLATTMALRPGARSARWRPISRFK